MHMGDDIMGSAPRVKDPIYGFVHLPPLCRIFMDTPEFQRLRRIQQLGNCHYVFPSAVHTRFEHSIGVMHLARVMASHLNVPPRWLQLIQLAALLHDLGHLAFSHLMEKIIPLDHEDRSVRLFLQINRRICRLGPDEEEAVGNMIRGKARGALWDEICHQLDDIDQSATGAQAPTPFPPLPGPPRSPPPYHYFEIVHNIMGGYDVDRMDYLQRDAYHTNMPGFQPAYIISASYVDDAGHVAFQAKADMDIEAMMFARKRMFTSVYLHHTVKTINALFVVMLSQMVLTEGECLKYDDGYLLHKMYKRFPVAMRMLDCRDIKSIKNWVRENESRVQNKNV